MSELKKLQAKHQKEIEELQRNCPHLEKSDWMDFWWAPGHSTGHEVRTCNRCGKILEKR